MISLDDLAWSQLGHAYGNASDIPSILRAVAGDPTQSSPSEGPWFELWSALCHQGDIYSASFAAVPHIIQTLAENSENATFDFFLFPAHVELARHRHNMTVPAALAGPYALALQRLPSLAAAASTRKWDTTFSRSALAAVAASKHDFSSCELLLEVDDDDTAEVLAWYFSR